METGTPGFRGTFLRVLGPGLAVVGAVLFALGAVVTIREAGPIIGVSGSKWAWAGGIVLVVGLLAIVLRLDHKIHSSPLSPGAPSGGSNDNLLVSEMRRHHETVLAERDEKIKGLYAQDARLREAYTKVQQESALAKGEQQRVWVENSKLKAALEANRQMEDGPGNDKRRKETGRTQDAKVGQTGNPSNCAGANRYSGPERHMGRMGKSAS